LVLTDLDLESPNAGLALATSLRSRQNAAVVFMTARIDSMTMATLVNEASAVVCKPFQHHQLEATLRFVLARQVVEAPATVTRQRELEATLRKIAMIVRDAVGVGTAIERVETWEVLSGLAPREQQVVRLLLQHRRVPAISRELGIK